jgi:hypothetical protein
MHDRPHQLTAARILITPPSADVFPRDDVSFRRSLTC